MNQCTHCKGNGYSPEARLMNDRWYGNAPFHPEDRGSTAFVPSHPNIQARATAAIERDPDFFGRGPLAHHAEAIRLCNLFNKAWVNHLNQDDVQALVDADRLFDLTHTFKDREWRRNDPPNVPTAQEVNDWSVGFGLGHDSINNWVVITAECKRIGCEVKCKYCDGEGEVSD